jgi:hypothetical protein
VAFDVALPDVVLKRSSQNVSTMIQRHCYRRCQNRWCWRVGDFPYSVSSRALVMSLTQYRHNAASILCCLLYQRSCELDKVSSLSCVDIYSTRCGIGILHVYDSLLPVCTCRVSCHCGIWYTWLYVDTRVPGRVYVCLSRSIDYARVRDGITF